jgi:hypothetical protein
MKDFLISILYKLIELVDTDRKGMLEQYRAERAATEAAIRQLSERIAADAVEIGRLQTMLERVYHEKQIKLETLAKLSDPDVLRSDDL